MDKVQRVEVTNRGFGHTLAIGFAVIFMACAVFGWGQYDSDDVHDRCLEHRGVQQVVDAAWLPTIDGKAMVVCKDGTVTEVH